MNIIRPRLALILQLALLFTLVLPFAARADAPALQVSPLDYRDSLTAGHVKTGYIDVSNPSDSPVQVEASVQGFRQTGTEGQLEFFDDPKLAAGITVGLSSFDLDPRAAVRVVFAVDPSKLPLGGVYAAIFFRTVPPPGASAQSSYVSESARIGTLLELTNGPTGPRQGTITSAHFPFWQFGRGLSGTLTYQNPSTAQAGYRPNLTSHILPWGKNTRLATGLVLSGSSRSFSFARPGSFFGLLPLVVTDQDTHKTATIWLFACTGIYQWILLVCLTIAAILGVSPATRPQVWHQLKTWLRIRHRSKPTKHPVDGISKKQTNPGQAKSKAPK